jgi:hypothetical protein
MATNARFVRPSLLARRRAAAPVVAAAEPLAAAAAPAEPASHRAASTTPIHGQGDDQAYAAAELVRLGLATRVTIVNASVDEALPDSWEIRGTKVGLVRLPARRTRMTLGSR